MNAINWQLKNFTELTGPEVYAICKLRQDVFIIEQQCTAPELDGQDAKALHLLGWDGGELVAYARAFGPGEHYAAYATFGRVAVAATARGTGLGRALTLKIITALEQQWPTATLKISAQYYLLNFYQSLGFQPVTEAYMEAGIKHIGMIKNK